MLRAIAHARRIATLSTITLLTVPLSAQRGPVPEPSTLPAEVLAAACAPQPIFAEPPMPLRVTGGQDVLTRRTFSPGELITINAGTANGIEVGQEYYVRRLQSPQHRRVTRTAPGNVHTTGWIRVYAVDEHLALATITHACDSIEVDDYLEPFVLPVLPEIRADKPKPERDNYARVLFGTDLHRAFGKGDFFVIDRGSNQGLTPGAQFVVYRDRKVKENFLYELGEAVAVSVGADTATLQVTLSRDAFMEGDYVALRK